MKFTFATKQVSSNGDEYWLKKITHDNREPVSFYADEPWQAAQLFLDEFTLAEGTRYMVIEEPQGRIMREYEARRPAQPLKPHRVRG